MTGGYPAGVTAAMIGGPDPEISEADVAAEIDIALTDAGVDPSDCPVRDLLIEEASDGVIYYLHDVEAAARMAVEDWLREEEMHADEGGEAAEPVTAGRVGR